MSALLRVAESTYPSSPVVSQLEAARAEIEDRFRTAGTVLNEVFGIVTGLASALNHLTEVLRADAIEDTTQGLLSAVDHLSGLPELQAERRRRLERIRAASAALRPHLDEMQTAVQYLRIFIFNIKITAADAGADDFTDFAGEMAGRVDFGSSELAAFDRQLVELSRCIGAGLGSEMALERQFGAVLPPMRTDLAGDAEAMRDHHRRITATAARVAVLTQAVQGKVARALGALQIGDITRQRVEHVQDALNMIERFRGDGADSERLGRAAHRMLAAQMIDASAHFRRDAGRVQDSLAGLAEDADQVLRLKDLTYLGSEQGGADFLHAIELSVEKAKALVATVQTASRDAEDVARSASSTAIVLAGRIAAVQRVKSDLHMMAMNTTLRCSRMGDAGRPLAVIAAELRSSAERLDVVAAAAGAALEALAAEGSACAAGEERPDATAMLDGAIAQIRRAGREAEASLQSIAGQSQRAAEVLARTERQFDFSRDLIDAMDCAAQQLVILGGPQHGPAFDGGPYDPAPLFDEIATLYTMAREREIHRLAIAPDGETAAAPGAAEPSDDDLEAALF